MRPVISAERMRAAEEAVWAIDPDVDLMARAAAGVAEAARAMSSGPVVVVVGPGNNGGDGLFAAAELAASRKVWLWLVTGRAHEAGLRAAEAAGCRTVDAVGAMAALEWAELVIDAFTGLGSRPGIPPEVRVFAAACTDLRLPVLSVDLPSGLDADSCLAHPSFAATRTVTFAALKPCHVIEPAASQCGDVGVVDIGVDVGSSALRQAAGSDLGACWPMPDATSDKYSRGVVGLDTGSAQYQGAALLGVAGALHSGAGMVRYLGPVPSSLVVGRYPSVVVGPGRCQAVVIGSGWGSADESRVRAAQDLGVPVVADADALLTLPSAPLERWLLTPHAGELARLLGVGRREVEADPVGHAREAAARTGATVLLKGASQVVAEPDGRATIAIRGPAWTAQAGSGDVLAGICGTLLAAGLSTWQAGVAAASIQAHAAGQHPGPYPPDVIATFLPQAIGMLQLDG